MIMMSVDLEQVTSKEVQWPVVKTAFIEFVNYRSEVNWNLDWVVILPNSSHTLTRKWSELWAKWTKRRKYWTISIWVPNGMLPILKSSKEKGKKSSPFSIIQFLTIHFLCRVKKILNVTCEIDNFFPGSFEYYNIRVHDDEGTDMLRYLNDTYYYISKAKCVYELTTQC